MATVTKVVCVLCGLNKALSAFDPDAEYPFGSWNAESPIIQIRDAPGGKAFHHVKGSGGYRRSAGRGFPVIDTKTLDQAKDDPEYSEYVDQITEQLLKVLKIFYEKKLISDEDIESVRG